MDAIPALSALMDWKSWLHYMADTYTDKGATATLANLEKWLDRLDNSAPAGLRLKGISYDRSYNDALGEPGVPDDFTVFAPWGTWARGVAGQENRDFPTPTQAAVLDVLAKGTTGSNQVFVDIASLNPSPLFFTESDKESIAEHIARVINSAPQDSQPIIRMLIGDDNASSRETYWQGWKSEMITSIFWKKDWRGHWNPRIEHPNARIYVGYYNPNFHPKSMEGNAMTFIKSILARIEKLVPPIGSILKNFDADKALSGLVTTGVRSITWNHAKIFAVNGKAVLTGGTNFWDEYSSRQEPWGKRIDHDIVDHAVKIFGDAAVSAHKWADYFWDYLDNPAETDDNSIAWAANLNEVNPKWWTRDGQIIGQDGIMIAGEITTANGKKKVNKIPANIIKSPFEKITGNTTGKIPVLTVAKLGDWHGDMNQLDYPVMVMDLARDLALNAFWQMSAGQSDGLLGLGGSIYGLNKLMSDEVLRFNLFKDFKITPAAWASRSTRTHAIAYAQNSVIICQQMLVQYLMAKDTDYKNAVQKANKDMNLQDPYKWDGFIWPFDLLIAIAQAIGTISKSKAKGDFKGVFIVETTKINKDRQDWEDQTSTDRVTNRIRRIMKGLPSAAGGIPDDQIEPALKQFLHFHRVENDDGTMFSHSKVVCVDRKLMYVGSDNAYPCYNEEHGVWIEDEQRVGNWVKNFFTPYWNDHSHEPKNETEHFKPGSDSVYLRENN